ncbi:hypothetical protein L484_027838 [Morus notabilis]|uniref:SAM domain-containing protein n=1 Tax=Morus notabilis TaxID=981085 RepID=W9RCZ9_9ROSA|nr:hypothetical protein L484_027838 [Morus notabilis]
MAETSRGRVTISLGRSGQVVKKESSGSDISFNESMPAVGTKRSVRDSDRELDITEIVHCGTSFGDTFCLLTLFRIECSQQGDISTSGSRANGSNDVRIGKDDLRLKLMRKNASRRAHSNGDRKVEDLRDKLKKAVRPPMPTPDVRQRLPEPKETGFFDRIPSTRSADDLPKIDSNRNSYSPWPVDHLRRRSPDRIPSTSRGLSPQRNVEEIPRRPLNRTMDDVRSVPYMSKDVIDTTRPMGTVGFTSNSALPPGPLKPVAPNMSQLPPLSSIISKSPYMVEEQQTVDGLLHSLGLGKYVVIFKAEEVDMTALKQMGENDLKELGIPMLTSLLLNQVRYLLLIRLFVCRGLGKRFFSLSCLVLKGNHDCYTLKARYNGIVSATSNPGSLKVQIYYRSLFEHMSSQQKGLREYVYGKLTNDSQCTCSRCYENNVNGFVLKV